MNSRKQTKMLLQIIIILASVLIILILVGSFMFFRFNMWKAWTNRGTRFYTPAQITSIKETARQNGEDAKVDEIKQRLEGGTGINAILRQFYPDDYIYTVDGRYYFSPINKNLKLNNLDNQKFVKDDNGEITYNDSSITTLKGIDVSQYQGNIDFSKVKNSGVEYAIIRCGYRGYESGTLTQDTKFDTNARNALANDVSIGAYFYTQATFNPVEVADNMKANGGFIPGIRSGKATEEYLQKVMSRITIVGAIFLALIATLPTVLSVIAPESLGSIHFGGTSLLIAVGVALETVRQLENQMLMRNYQGFLK